MEDIDLLYNCVFLVKIKVLTFTILRNAFKGLSDEHLMRNISYEKPLCPKFTARLSDALCQFNVYSILGDWGSSIVQIFSLNILC